MAVNGWNDDENENDNRRYKEKNKEKTMIMMILQNKMGRPCSSFDCLLLVSPAHRHAKCHFLYAIQVFGKKHLTPKSA